jgi:hypothetical protein
MNMIKTRGGKINDNKFQQIINKEISRVAVCMIRYHNHHFVPIVLSGVTNK